MLPFMHMMILKEQYVAHFENLPMLNCKVMVLITVTAQDDNLDRCQHASFTTSIVCSLIVIQSRLFFWKVFRVEYREWNNLSTDAKRACEWACGCVCGEATSLKYSSVTFSRMESKHVHDRHYRHREGLRRGEA